MANNNDSGLFVGHQVEVGTVRGLVQAVASGCGGVVFVEGEPGIGKSAVVAEAVAGAGEAGCTVFWGQADPLLGRSPLGVMLDCLEVDPRSPDGVRAEIAALLRGEGAGQIMPRGDVAAAAERLLVLVDQLCAASPVVLVVDDLQWADEESVSVWHRLAGATSQMPLLMVGLARSVPISSGLAVARQSMARRGGTVVSVGPLSDAEVAELVGGLVGAWPDAGLMALAEQAGGNPLYVHELIDALVREDRLVVAGEVAQLAVGAGNGKLISLAAAIEGRLGFLSEGALAALRVAALLGVRFSVRDLATIAGLGARELVAVVSEAVAAGVLMESGLDLAFRHGLIAQGLVDGMPAGLQSQLRQDAARVLARAGAAAERVAGLLLEAGAAGVSWADDEDRWVVEWLTGHAAELARRDPRSAAELLGLVVTGVAARDPRRAALTEQLAGVLSLLGRHDQAEPLARGLLEASGDAMVRARMAWTLAFTLMHSGRAVEAIAVAEQAAGDAAELHAWRARLLSVRSLAMLSTDRINEAVAAAAEALADAERAGDRLAAGYALHVQSYMHGLNGDGAGLLRVTERALALIGDDPDGTDLRLLLLSNRLTALCNLGRDADAEACELLTLAEQAGTARLGAVRCSVAEYLFDTGHWDDALAEINVLFEPGADLLDFAILGGHGVAALIAAHRDDPAGFIYHLGAAPDPSGVRHVERLYLVHAKALAAERDGRPDEALALLSAVAADDSIYEPPEHYWHADRVRCALAAGDPVAAESAAASCEQAASQPGASRDLAEAARWCRGVANADPAMLADVVAYRRTLRRPLGLGQSLEDLAVAQAERGDSAAARATLREAIECYTGLGADWDILRADTRLRSFGIRRSRAGKRRPATGWAALTPTETKVARLVAEGLSNPEVGTRLFLSRNTVQTHVANILAKLQIHSRVGIAAEVAHQPPAVGSTA